MAKRKKFRPRPTPNTQRPTPDAQPRSLPTPSFGVRSSLSHAMKDGEEYPTRSPELAHQLIDLVNNCPEAAAALEVICAYTLSSGTGDEMGFSVQVDEQNPHAGTVAIAQNVLSRVGDIFTWWQVIWRLMAWGDSFGLLDVDTKAMMVTGLRLLPSWQCFVVPDEVTGEMSHYEQRMGRGEVAQIPTLNMIQWSYNRRYLYGRSLYHECLDDWARMQNASEDVSAGSREAVINPNLHFMPPGSDDGYKRAYKDDHEARKKQGLVTDIYLLQGADVRKPQGLLASYPINGLLDSFNVRRLRIAARSRVPLYLLGIESKFAREIAYQPAIAFVVQVGVIRQLFAAGLRQLINTELALKQVPPAQWQYRIVFPKINVNPWKSVIEDDVNGVGVNDLDG